MSSVILKTARKHQIPVRIAHSHSSNQDKDWKYPIKLFYRAQISKHATALFACGLQAGQWMFRGHPFRILNNAIDANTYAFSPSVRTNMRLKLAIPNNAYVVGHVGRFSPPKNHIGLLDIFAEIYRRDNHAMLLLVGDDKCKLGEMIHQKIQKLRLENNVIFAGVRTDVNALLQAMDVFVFPSNYEGLPVTLVEAQAAGLPCYVSDHVPSDCILTNLVNIVPLSAPPAIWAENILSPKANRKNTYNEIVAAGFDITENANWLQNFYLEQWKAIDTSCQH